MTSAPIPAEPESLAALHEQSARHLHAMLLGLAEMGVELAALYVQQAKDQIYAGSPGAGPSPECAAAYNGVTRSVRQSAMLAQKLLEPAPARKADDEAARKISQRKTIIRRIEDSLYRDAPEDQADTLHAELLERLEDPEFDDELGHRPTDEIVNEIRADLGILGSDSLDYWKRRTPADIAVLSARAAGRSAADQSSRAAPDEPDAGRWPEDTRIRGP
jgi:hypothetical protein